MQNYQFESDRAFVRAVESCELPASEFSHRSHIRLACIYFWSLGFDAGLKQTQNTIKTYAHSLGATEKYHATLTYAYYRLVADILIKHPLKKCWQDVEHLFFNEEAQLSREQVQHHYSEFILSTAEAKQKVLMPDKLSFESDEIFEQANFEWIEGEVPVLISMPHNGTCIPKDIAKTMNPRALKVADTDWYLRLLYSFVLERGCYLINPLYSRYVIDLNRPGNGEVLYPGANNTELCPTSMFDFEPMYQAGQTPTQSEIERRKRLYWEPYHQQLARGIEAMKAKFGKVLLFEAHSIASRVPRFFEGQLPDFNFGTNGGVTCSESIARVVDNFDTKTYSKIINGRFKGGYITRSYANVESNVSTLQLELSQATYMNESTLEFDHVKADAVRPVLSSLIDALLNAQQ